MPLPDWLQPRKAEIPTVTWWATTDRIIQGERARTRYKMELSDLQTNDNPFPNSTTNVPTKRTIEEYSAFLEPYKSITISDKTDFLNSEPAIGHKVHLNVAPENVRQVSAYLKEHRYAHKYISGGDVEDGKIFTIYFGSLEMAKKHTTVLSQDLHDFLLRPLDKTEIEYAPNISGRFVGDPKEFTQYALGGTRGLSSLKTLVYNDTWAKRTQEEQATHLMNVFNQSYDKLADIYGEYFYGK